jgi:hypothetical protein
MYGRHVMSTTPHRPAPTTTTRLLAALSLVAPALGALAWAPGCSLVVDFTECEVNADCERLRDVCVEGLCQSPDTVEVTDFIVEDTKWTKDKVYVLKNVILVIQPATLTIEPGTLILGERDSALVTQAGAKLIAVGTREEPIVMTSAKPEGQRRAGDWGGLALVGKASINRNPMLFNIVTGEEEIVLGGDDDEWDCGKLKYVRTEFGGGLIEGEKALNGLTLAACGSQTEVDYVQAHFGDDDGIEIFGGTVNVTHAVSSRAQGDAFDLDVGWRGKGQFWIAQLDVNGAEAIEIENRGEEPTATPQTDPQIYNYTVVGAEGDEDSQRGMIFKAGGLARLSHGIVMGVGDVGAFIEGTESGQHTAGGRVLVEHTLFYDVGTEQDAPLFTADEDAGAVVDAVSVEQNFTSAERGNTFGLDPGFSAPYDLGAPGLVPSAEHTTSVDIPRPPEGFDTTAVYLGALSPGNPAWTEGWTAYPKF